MASGIIGKYVFPGNKVDIKPISRARFTGDSEKKEKYYQSKVFDIISEDRIEILMPMEQAKLVLLPVGGEYYLYFYSASGLYQCKAKIENRSKRKNVYVLVMELTSNLRKEQRREYYRFSCALAMNSIKLEEEEIERIKSGAKVLNEDFFKSDIPIKRSVIVDISGGGLRFVADSSYEVGEIILCRCQLELPEGTKTYELAGKVLSIKENENRPGIFEHRIQYINIKREEREEIIKYIFEEERKKLKNKIDE